MKIYTVAVLGPDDTIRVDDESPLIAWAAVRFYFAVNNISKIHDSK